MSVTQGVLNSLNVREERVRFSTLDASVLSGTWFTPDFADRPLKTAVVVVCGAGVPARAYRKLARHLASQGAAVLTFDYRGIGESRKGSLRELRDGMEHWGAYDIEAALKEALTSKSGLVLAAVAHSVGTLLLGAAPSAKHISRLVFLGPHTGYWRDYAPRRRVILYLVWHKLMPALTRHLGYFPGKMLRLGEDLPPQIALDWAGRIQPELIMSEASAGRFHDLLARYPNMQANTLSLTVTDDPFAPDDAATRLLALYPNLRVTREIINPRKIKLRRLGHFGFLSNLNGDYLWKRTSDWLLQNNIGY
jgi:predicted alpha/beta hydrolase